jgi:tRNA threonylcarbamoyladenosine biosynthesis protein TsaB
MRVLALDTTTRAGSVAVLDDRRVIVERTGDGSRTHAERLPAEVLDVLAAAGSSTADVDLFAVASGPGSFTGLRIGIATIQGLAFVHGRRVAAVSALRALAEGAAQGMPPGTRVGAWMDAYRREVFSALYEVRDSKAAAVADLVELEEATVGSPAATIERWTRAGAPAIICGDGAVIYEAMLSGVTVMPPPALAGFIGQLAVVAAQRGTTVGPAGVQPLYVRRPDAEIAREAAGAKR